VLTRLSDRLARESAPVPSGVRLDVCDCLAGLDPAALEGLGRAAAGVVGLQGAA
jgi:hypothetical protein